MGLQNDQSDSLDDITMTCNSNFQFHLLFHNLPKRPTAAQLKNKLSTYFGDITTIMDEEEMMVFSLEAYPIPYSENRLKTKLVMTETFPFNLEQIIKTDPEAFIKKKEYDTILQSAHYTILITDMLASSLEYKVRCEILVNWIKIAVEQFDEVVGVLIPSAKKLIHTDEIKNRTSEDLMEFLFLGVNIRVFSTLKEDEFIVDTLGMHAIGRCDVEYCFHGVNTQVAVEYAYYIASEILKHGEVIESIDHLIADKEKKAEWKFVLSNATFPTTRKLLKVIAI